MLRTLKTNPNKPRILFVDDEVRILSGMQSMFRFDYEVVTTESGIEALELLKKNHFELIVSDQRMPIMKGVDLLRKAKDVSPDTVRILLTGYSDLADIAGSLNEGEIFRFINKPWDNEQLEEIIKEGVNVGIALAAERFISTQEPTLKPVKNPIPNSDGIIIINGDAAMLDFVKQTLPRNPVFQVGSHLAALDILNTQEIAIIVSSMDGDHRKDTEFFAALKREHPQITSIIIAPSGNSDALISLINHARVFRYMFKPLRTNLLSVYLNSALDEYLKFKDKPALLAQQKPDMREVTNSPQVSPSLSSAIKGLRRFFKSNQATL